MTDFSDIYCHYIALLNGKDLTNLHRFVAEEIFYNDEKIGLQNYQKLLEQDFEDIPDLYYTIDILVSSSSYVASRLTYDCTPKDEFLGLPINGRKVRFSENVFYHFENSKIKKVFSVIDKSAIEKQIKNE
ncbi:ester cyclase [Olivibacter sp. SDN3]|uniref:ester cyclase n=1 Tax=Olivibacter sp. SDN3 TaxID=2764720 RepID=UPI0016518640|nr:ester cyclase [Olivibacter sp. SDN3]QNL52308.1 ester cyclase [Olivibacter sp. SDN3]